MVIYFMIANYNIQLIYKLLIYLIGKLLTIFLDIKIVNMILIILNLYNLENNFHNFYI